MITVTEARQRLIEAHRPLQAEIVPLSEALGRVLAAPVIAVRDQPPFNASAMDGYAFASGSVPRDLSVVGESAAGRPYSGLLADSQAVRISTGAPIPEGADTVLVQEESTLREGALLGVSTVSGRHIRPRGCDFAAGELLLDKGDRLDPIAIALAASAGTNAVSCVAKPQITIFACGDEIVPPGTEPNPAQVFESGSYGVSGFAEVWGAEVTRASILPDNRASMVASITEALSESDLVVVIGGASVGPHDHARPAVAQLGLEPLFEKVAVRPGKPTWFAQGEPGAVLGLPGNPASAMVCAILFLHPCIKTMLGEAVSPTVPVRRAPLASRLAANGARTTYLRAKVDGGGRLIILENQDSSLLSVFSQASVLVEREANAPPADAGAPLPYLRWSELT